MQESKMDFSSLSKREFQPNSLSDSLNFESYLNDFKKMIDKLYEYNKIMQLNIIEQLYSH